MSVNVDCTLFPAGRRAAEQISDKMESDTKSAARRFAKNRFGWDPLGEGISRVAFDLPVPDDQLAFELAPGTDEGDFIENEDACIVKVAVPHSGQMVEEVEQWRKIAGVKRSNDNGDWTKLRDLVAPVKDYDASEYRWLTMPKGDTDAVHAGAARELTEAAEELGFATNDIHADNVAMFNGEPRMIDLGHDFTYTGFLPGQKWRSFEDALERIGCRDVRLVPARRKFRQFKFRHPLRVPGIPFERQESFLEFDKGGNFRAMELYFPIVPDDVANRLEVQNLMDEVLDIRSVPGTGPVQVGAARVSEGILPSIESNNHPIGEGADISQVRDFMETVYDRYDARFTPIVEESDWFDREVDPPSAPPEGEGVLSELEEEFDGIVADE